MEHLLCLFVCLFCYLLPYSIISTRLGCKVHRLYIRNNCATPMKIGIYTHMYMHWICNSGIWKVVHVGKWPGKRRKEPCFTLFVARHRSVVAYDLGFELAGQPPYSPNLAPSDYALFFNMKKQHCMAGKQYRTYDEVIICSWRIFWGSWRELLHHGNPGAAALHAWEKGLWN